MLTEHPLLQAARSGLPNQEELNQARKDACVTRQRLKTVQGLAELSQAERTVSRCNLQRGDDVGLIRSACLLSIQLQKQGTSSKSVGHFHGLLDQVLRMREARAAPGSATALHPEHILAASGRSDDVLSRPVLRLSGSWAVKQGRGHNLRTAASQHSNTQDQDPMDTYSKAYLGGRRRTDQASSPSNSSGDDKGGTVVRAVPSRGGVSRFFGSVLDSCRVGPRAVEAPAKGAPAPASNSASQQRAHGRAQRVLATSDDADATASTPSSDDARHVRSTEDPASPRAGRGTACTGAVDRHAPQPQQPQPSAPSAAPNSFSLQQTGSAPNAVTTSGMHTAPLSTSHVDARRPAKPSFRPAADKPRRLAIKSYPDGPSSTSSSPSSSSLTSSSSDLAAGRYPNRMRFRPCGPTQPRGNSREGKAGRRERQTYPASGGAGGRRTRAGGRCGVDWQRERDQGRLLRGDSDTGEEADRGRVAAVVGRSRAVDRARGEEPRGSRRMPGPRHMGRGYSGAGREKDEDEEGRWEEEAAERWQRSKQGPGGIPSARGPPRPYSAWREDTDELQAHLNQPALHTRSAASGPGGSGGSGAGDGDGQPPVGTTLWQRRWEQRRRCEQQLGMDSNEGSQHGAEGQERGQGDQQHIGQVADMDLTDGDGGYRQGYGDGYRHSSRAAAAGSGSVHSSTSPLLKSAVRSAAAAVEAAVMALGGLHGGGEGCGGAGGGESSAGSAGSSPLRGSVHMGHEARGRVETAGGVAAGAGWPVSGGLVPTGSVRPGSAGGSLGGVRGGSRLSLEQQPQQQRRQLWDEQGQGQGQDQGGAHPDLSYLLDSPVGSEGGASSVASVHGVVREEAGAGRGRLGTQGRGRLEAGVDAGGDRELMVRSLAEGLGAAAAAHAAAHARVRVQQPQQLQSQPQQPQPGYPQPQSRAPRAPRAFAGQQAHGGTAVGGGGEFGLPDAGEAKQLGGSTGATR